MRWQLLCALRALALGAVLIVQVDAGLLERHIVFFDGQLLPQLVGRVLLQREWIQPCHKHWMADSMFYWLSPVGVQALEAGLRWWRSLPIYRRLLLRLIE